MEYEYHLYQVTEWEGTPENRLREEHSEIRWVSLEEAAKLELASAAYLPYSTGLPHVVRRPDRDAL